MIRRAKKPADPSSVGSSGTSRYQASKRTMSGIPTTTNSTSTTVGPESSTAPMRRGIGIRTTDCGGATSGSSSGARRSSTREPTKPRAGAAARAGADPAASARAPDASRSTRSRNASASRERRYCSGRFASLPATWISSLAAPMSRARRGRTMLTPWIRSSRARRFVRDRMPLRTSTVSSVTRNVCMRHDRYEMPTARTVKARRPRITQMRLPDSTSHGIRSPSPPPPSPWPGTKRSTSCSRREETRKPIATRNTTPPRRTGVAGWRRCQPPSVSSSAMRASAAGTAGAAASASAGVGGAALAGAGARSGSGPPDAPGSADPASVTAPPGGSRRATRGGRGAPPRRRSGGRGSGCSRTPPPSRA
ncbi:hypothetical protein BFL36_00265 [Clavibacter michiganensis]|uniref:Uncharacterized protein n=1 Tax=Clavibacter michiganensis TaxID=28447 RepID=A0A251YXF6_9MICO|nr:hypothetical protein BFL36_00265 [Clavibacter michiganensis]